MNKAERDRLREIKTFPSLVKYLRDELHWPIESDDFEDISFDYTAEELGIDAKTAAKVLDIKQLRPLADGQPWGIFFVKFEPKRLPVVALRRILSRLVFTKRAAVRQTDRAAWDQHDLLFISNFGEGEHRQITFAHFTDNTGNGDLPTLKVLGWDDEDTALHIDHVHDELHNKLSWPEDDTDLDGWRGQWRGAFELRHREVVTSSKQLAQRLAELATNIRKRCNAAMKIETAKGPLRSLWNAFKEALIHDLEPDDFADMYAQTIAYGLLSARASRPGGLTADNLADMVPVTNPFLKDLMLTFLDAGGRKYNESKERLTGIDFDELGINDVVDTLREHNISAILRDFGNQNMGEDPVIYFYEDFLKAYDSKKRMDRGVFYTPRPVVSYIVRSVHELLQTEFGVADGLADTTTWAVMLRKHKDLKLPEIEFVDPITREVSSKPVDPSTPFVQILDPATGTATFLVEVIDVIYKTMTAKWEKEGHPPLWIGQKWNDYVPKHLLPRLYGYELMMAPYAIAHMKIGLKLFETGYKFGSGERARIYLTNALELPHDLSDTFEQMAPALAHEAKAVNAVKRHQRFTVVIGNPPYAGHSLNASRDSNNKLTWIGRLIEDYKQGCPELFKPAQAKWLQDDYVKFIRFSEATLTAAGGGILGFITNHAYLNNPTFRGMRRNLLRAFSSMLLIDLHGNVKRTELVPNADSDENVFDIQQGVAIQISVAAPRANRLVQHDDLWGLRESKYRALLCGSIRKHECNTINPMDPLYLLIPRDDALLPEYSAGWRIPEIFSEAGDPAIGIVSTHDGFAYGYSRADIAENVESLLRTNSEAEARTLFRLCTQDQWDYGMAKRELKDGAWRGKLLQVLYRPFDFRFTIDDSNVAVHRRDRVLRHLINTKNLVLCTNRQVNGEFRHVLCTRHMATDCTLSTASKERTYVLPLYLAPDGLNTNERRVNLNSRFMTALSKVVANGSETEVRPEDVFHYIYAVLHSPQYRARYIEFLRSDFPRIPLPLGKELFHDSAALGASLAAHHLLEVDNSQSVSVKYLGAARPEIERVVYKSGTVWLDKTQTCGFAGVPEAVWNFRMGGYQVCEKWLKDRKGRTLSKTDIAHYQKIVVSLNETIRLMMEIDQTVEKHGGWPGAFVTDPWK